MKKHKKIAVSLLLTVLFTGSVLATYQVNQFNDAQIRLKRSLLDVQQKQTWIGDENGRFAMEVVKQSEIGIACIYPKDSKERTAVIEAGYSLLKDEKNWYESDSTFADTLKFLQYGSTTGAN